MDITGWDLVVFTFTRPRDVFARVFASILARWPGALVHGFDSSPSARVPVADVPAKLLPEGEGHLLFYRDEAMARHMEESAFVPMADGDGPFAVITRERREIVFEVSGLNEVRAADHTPTGPRPPDPYQAWLCTPLLVEVTAVTPGDPDSQEFAGRVLSEVKRACGP